MSPPARQPRSARGRFAPVALALASAGLAAAPFALSGLRVQPFGPPAPIAQPAVTVLFALPGQLGCPGAPAGGRSVSVARAAAADDGTPGAAPVVDGQAPEASGKKEKPRPGHETETQQFDRVAKRVKFLKSLKGKYTPYGPKPWDKPRFMKVCIQTRLNAKQAANTKIMNQCVEELRRVSGMHPWIVKAKHNVAAFGWRVGDPCGVAVTLRGPLMYDFLERLNTIILPRIRDFEGLIANSFDNKGNFWMGLENQEPFRELDDLIDTRELVHGFDIGIINNCQTQPDGMKLMKDYGFPFGKARWKPVKVKKFNVAPKGKR